MTDGLPRRILMTVTLPLLILITWWFVSKDSTDPFWPPLREIFSSFSPTWFEGRMRSDVLPSLMRLAVGYAAAVVSGIGLGIFIGSSKAVREYLEPVLEFLRAIPAPVLIPIIMLFAGIGDGMKIIVIAFGSVWPILLNTVEGVRSVDEVLTDTSTVYRLRPHTKLFHLVMRGASPQIFAGARQALSIAIILMVISEMFAARNGIGFTTLQFQRTFAVPEMWTGIFMLGIIGVALAFLFRIVERRVTRLVPGHSRDSAKGLNSNDNVRRVHDGRRRPQPARTTRVERSSSSITFRRPTSGRNARSRRFAISTSSSTRASWSALWARPAQERRRCCAACRASCRSRPARSCSRARR